MSEQAKNYDDVRQYRLNPEREQELLKTAGECTFIWANKAGHPMGVTTAFVPVGGKIWMTATRERVRFLDTPERIVMEFTSEMSIPFDGDKMAAGTSEACAEFEAAMVVHGK